MTTAEIIAICGVGIAALVGAWKVLMDLRDKTHLKVDAKFGLSQHTMGDRPLGEPQKCLQVTITNTGRHPLKASIVGGKWRQARVDGDRFTLIPPYGLPKLLTPGDSHTEIYWKPEQLGLLTDLDQMWVQDASGKLWYAAEKDIEDLRVWGGVINK